MPTSLVHNRWKRFWGGVTVSAGFDAVPWNLRKIGFRILKVKPVDCRDACCAPRRPKRADILCSVVCEGRLGMD